MKGKSKGLKVNLRNFILKNKNTGVNVRDLIGSLQVTEIPPSFIIGLPKDAKRIKSMVYKMMREDGVLIWRILKK